MSTHEEKIEAPSPVVDGEALLRQVHNLTSEVVEGRVTPANLYPLTLYRAEEQLRPLVEQEER